jgi:hypothetical protein
MAGHYDIGGGHGWYTKIQSFLFLQGYSSTSLESTMVAPEGLIVTEATAEKRQTPSPLTISTTATT